MIIKKLYPPIFSVLLLLIVFNSVKGQLTAYSLKENEQPKTGSAMIQDKSGSVWFCTTKEGVYRYDGKSFTHFGLKEITNWVFYMTEDKAGNLWFSYGINGGVTCYDGKTIKNFNNENGLCYKTIWCLTADREGNIWFMNRDKSLCSYNGKIFRSITE